MEERNVEKHPVPKNQAEKFVSVSVPGLSGVTIQVEADEQGQPKLVPVMKMQKRKLTKAGDGFHFMIPGRYVFETEILEPSADYDLILMKKNPQTLFLTGNLGAHADAPVVLC